MNALPCPRLWEVEAVLDGRLTGAERAAWERHRETCSSCAHESRVLGRLREVTRAGATPERRPLEARRERARLLELADASATGRHRAAARTRPWAIALAFALVCGSAVVFTHLRAGARPHEATPAVAIDASRGALWSEERAGDKRRIRLDEGTLTLRLDHADAVVLTPDGEIEDTGTTFSVTVAGGRTERVAVVEGSVVVRLQGHAPFDLQAGGAWTAAPGTAIASAPPPALVAKAAAPPPPRDAAARPPRTSVEPRVTAPASDAPPAASASSAAVDEATIAFAAAMKAMSEGRLVDAAALFQAFERAHAGDARAEDAAYLRVVALERAGRRNAARIAARDYVARHPSGFRRKEVDSLAAEPSRP